MAIISTVYSISLDTKRKYVVFFIDNCTRVSKVVSVSSAPVISNKAAYNTFLVATGKVKTMSLLSYIPVLPWLY